MVEEVKTEEQVGEATKFSQTDDDVLFRMESTMLSIMKVVNDWLDTMDLKPRHRTNMNKTIPYASYAHWETKKSEDASQIHVLMNKKNGLVYLMVKHPKATAPTLIKTFDMNKPMTKEDDSFFLYMFNVLSDGITKTTEQLKGEGKMDETAKTAVMPSEIKAEREAELAEFEKMKEVVNEQP